MGVRRVLMGKPEFQLSFFADFWVRVTSGARGSVSVGFWGDCQLSPFFWGGGSSQRAVSPTPEGMLAKSRVHRRQTKQSAEDVARQWPTRP